MSDTGFQRVGFAVGSQTSGFKFEGRGEIIAATFYNELTPFIDDSNPTGVKCGLALTFHPLDANWKRVDAEPVTEVLGAGPVTKFHPGKAADPTSPADDMGGEPEAEGNCLLSGPGKEPDKKSKLFKFAESCMASGVKQEIFNGWADNLLGMKANFYQAPQPRGQNQREGTADPTCLAVKAQEIWTFPTVQGGGPGANGASPAGLAGPAGPAASAQTASGPVVVPPKPAGGAGVSGKKKDTGAAPASAATATSASPSPSSAPAHAHAQVTSPSSSSDPDAIAAAATAVLSDIYTNPKYAKGDVTTNQKLGPRVTVAILDHRDPNSPKYKAPTITSDMDKQIQGLLKTVWLVETSEAFGVTVEGDEAALAAGTAKVTIPATA